MFEILRTCCILDHIDLLTYILIKKVELAEGLAHSLRSVPPNPEVPGLIPSLVEG